MDRSASTKSFLIYKQPNFEESIPCQVSSWFFNQYQVNFSTKNLKCLTSRFRPLLIDSDTHTQFVASELMVSDQISWSCGCHSKFPQTKTNLNSKRSCPKSNNIPSRIGCTPLSMHCDSQNFLSFPIPYQIHGLCFDRLELFQMAKSSQKKVTDSQS